jgi:uncharacterized membrane protein YebE (DUF533 family)
MSPKTSAAEAEKIIHTKILAANADGIFKNSPKNKVAETVAIEREAMPKM